MNPTFQARGFNIARAIIHVYGLNREIPEYVARKVALKSFPLYYIFLLLYTQMSMLHN